MTIIRGQIATTLAVTAKLETALIYFSSTEHLYAAKNRRMVLEVLSIK